MVTPSLPVYDLCPCKYGEKQQFLDYWESAAGQQAKSAFPPGQMEFCKSPVNPTEIISISLWTGHEYPFGITMSHIRDAMPHGSKHCACPRQLQGPFLPEQLPQELQCQFVLKPSQVAVCQQLNGTLSPLPRSVPTHSLATWLCCRRHMCWAGGAVGSAEERAGVSSSCSGGLRCSSHWSECAVVYVSSLKVTFWQAACQVIVLKSAKERQNLSPLQFFWVC